MALRLNFYYWKSKTKSLYTGRPWNAGSWKACSTQISLSSILRLSCIKDFIFFIYIQVVIIDLFDKVHYRCTSVRNIHKLSTHFFIEVFWYFVYGNRSSRPTENVPRPAAAKSLKFSSLALVTFRAVTRRWPLKRRRYLHFLLDFLS